MHDKQTAKAQALLATKAQLCRPKQPKASNTTPLSQPPYRSVGPKRHRHLPDRTSRCAPTVPWRPRSRADNPRNPRRLDNEIQVIQSAEKMYWRHNTASWRHQSPPERSTRHKVSQMALILHAFQTNGQSASSPSYQSTVVSTQTTKSKQYNTTKSTPIQVSRPQTAPPPT
jgi:hypothetical protein